MNEVELLRKLVSINSIFPNEGELGEFLEGYLKDIGFRVERQYISEGRFNLLAERGSEGTAILLYGHMDTVPEYGGWKNNPFEIIENGDRLQGLGTWDMKSGIAAILKAIEEPSNRRIKIVFGVDEENISEGAHNIIKSEFVKGVEGIIVTEAGDSEMGALGPKMITLGRRGRAVYEININGESAHGATNKGKSAILVASKIVQFLESQELIDHQFLPRASQFVRSINAKMEGLSIPDKATLELDRHLVPPQTIHSVFQELDKQMDGFREENVRIEVKVKERKTPYLEPYITERNEDFVKKIVSIIENKYGEVIYNYGLSVADENVFSTLGIPVITMGPKGDEGHNANEWVSKKSYLEVIEILKKIIYS